MDERLVSIAILTVGHGADLWKDVGADHIISAGDSRSLGGVQLLLGVFGCKEVGGSKEMEKYNCSFSYLSKHR